MTYNGVERIQSITLRRRVGQGSWENLQRVLYAYYGVPTVASSSSSSSSGVGPGDQYGTEGDLKTATYQHCESGAWVEDGVAYYRYWKSGDAAGFVHGLKYVVEPPSYAALLADPDVTDPLTATNSKVAQYADYYFEYGNVGRVTRERVYGGALESTFSYVDSTLDRGYNVWNRKTTETRPDGSEMIVYTNYVGEVLLRELRAGGESSIEYFEYDDNAQMTLHATPAAIESYTDSNGHYWIPLLVTYRSASGSYTVGLVELSEYYATTNLGQGAVAGYLKARKIRKGRDGTPILLRSYQYTGQSIPLCWGSSSSSSSSGAGQEQAVYPLSKITVYRNEDGTGQIATNYSYTWHSGTLQMLQRTTTLPAVPVEQGGSGVSATRTERFDTKGNLVWLKDERGFITYHEHDVVKGVVTKTIEDVDGTKLTLPSGWSTPSGGGKHLVSDYQYDSLGRTVQTLGPEHTAVVDGSATTIRTASWAVYKDSARETWSANGFATLGSSSSSSSGSSGPDYSYTLVNPVSIQKRNAAGTRSESIAATRASTAGKLSAFDSFAQSSYVRWSVTLANAKGQTTATRQYHMIPSSGDGSSGTNYDETTYGYDAYGRQNKVKTPGGTITRTVFDAFGRAACTYVGTDDSGATDADPSTGREPCSSGPFGPSSSSSSSSANPNNNMVLVTESVYAGAGGCSGCGGGGSGQLVQTNQFVDAQNYRVTEFLYDWRNRQEFVLADADDQGRFTFSRSQYDNLGRMVKAERYHDVHGDGPDPDGGIHPDDVLIARSESFHDDRGQVYMTKTYAVDPATGTVGSALAGYAWHDAAGSPIKQQPPGSKLFTKTTYDSLGRVYETFTGYDTSEPLPRALGESSSSSSSSGPTSYDCATNVDGDTILEQSRADYDAAGSVLLSTLWRRLHNATGTGRLNDPSGSQPRGRRSYAASWYDAIGRQIASANYGTNGGSSLTRPDAVPARSDTVLVNSTSYNSAGQAETTTNPAGIVAKLEYDAAGRVVKQIANYVAASSSSSSSGACPAPDDVNVTVQTAYNADGNVSSITAVNSSTGSQVTQYIYGTTLSDSAIASSLLKRAEVYPDSADSTDRIEFKYNRQGEVTEVKDQAGTVHAFDFDKLGRQTQDRATTLASGVDGAVRRIASTYEVRGMREKLTSYDNPNVGSGTVDNEAKFSYNSFAQLTTEYQEHGGAVNTSTSPKVQYGYANGGESTIRPTQLTYPNGRVLNFNYGSSGGTGDASNRVAALLDNDGSSHLVDYSYLGLGLPSPFGRGAGGEGGFVKADYAEPDVRWDLAFGTGNDPHDGLDRFDRVVDNRWLNYATSTDVDRIQYGHDRSGSRTYREQTSDSNSYFDEVYAYDLIDRLKSMDRGPLNAQKSGVTTLKFAQCWALDSTGNWRDFREDADGAGGWDLVQSRTHNGVNEISDITETVGAMWITPQYDRAGNMTRVPKPSDPTQYYTCTYDAWNRLVKVQDGGNTVAEYRYDGAKRRIVKKTYSGGQLQETRHLYYTEPSTWQVIEERVGASSYADRQFVWGLRYIDDLVLRDRDADGNVNTGNLGKSGSGMEERLYALQDANWNVTALSNPSGSIQERCAYSAYGAPLFLTGTFGTRATSSYAWETLFAGYRWDAEIVAACVRNRFLRPGVGWLQRDPLGLTDSVNLYAYALNSPLTLRDPYGLAANWHHLLPREYAVYFKNFDIDAPQYGWILEVDHQTGKSKIHPEWNREWGKFFHSNHNAKKEEILAQLRRMMRDPRFAPALAKGVPATRTGMKSYKAWKALTAEMRAKAVKEAARRLGTQGAKKGTKKVAGKVGRRIVKKVPVVGLAFLIWDIQEKGVAGGIANTLLDQVPFLGWVKLADECLEGDWIPDRDTVGEQ